MMETPSQWPESVSTEYDPVRSLGKGGFASVRLARRKKDGELVAMKVVGSRNATEQQCGYAHREIDILRELDHPNVMRLVSFWEPLAEEHTCAAVMALSYASGPTLQQILSKGGAVSLLFAQVVSAQLVDAVAYLHSRAVIHRDIKPDNLIVGGANIDQNKIWDDITKPPDTEDGWKELLNEWNVTLVDFGFARALTAEDLKKRPPQPRRGTSTTIDQSMRSTESDLSSTNLSVSMSRRLVRRMSAVGNRNYAAPEVTKDIQVLDISHHFGVDADITHNLSEYVSYYGLLADSYSVGTTIKYMVTGAPPHEDVNELLGLENSLVGILLRCCAKKDDTAGERKVKYRRYSEIPGDVARMIRCATSREPSKRSSVRELRLYPWIDRVLVDRTSAGLRQVHLLDLDKPPVPLVEP